MSDLISKAEVLETYADLFDVFDDSPEIRKELCKVYDKINKLPYSEPEKVCIANVTFSDEQLREAVEKAKDEIIHVLPSAESEWNNHTVACLLAEMFGDDCACNFNGIDEWLPEKCEVIDSCPNPVGVACWEQFLKHRSERRTDERLDKHTGEDWYAGMNCAESELYDLPSAQPEHRWIPVTERLPEHPENDDYYLVTIQCEHYDGWDDYVTGLAEWTKHGWDEMSCYIGQIKVVAWMPLPEPWKGDTQE